MNSLAPPPIKTHESPKLLVRNKTWVWVWGGGRLLELRRKLSMLLTVNQSEAGVKNLKFSSNLDKLKIGTGSIKIQRNAYTIVPSFLV